MVVVLLLSLPGRNTFPSILTNSVTSLHDHIKNCNFLSLPPPRSVLPRAILCPHYVHQLRAERKRLSHCLQWVVNQHEKVSWSLWVSFQMRHPVNDITSLSCSPSIRDDGRGSWHCSWYSHPGTDCRNGERSLPPRTWWASSTPEQLVKVCPT